MKIITMAAQKGGAGKTTLAVHLAVAAGEGAAIIDMDPQASASQWHASRQGSYPQAAKAIASNLPRVLDDGRAAGFTWCIIDTPPHSDLIQGAAVEAATFVIIPARPTVLDLRAIAPTVATVKRFGKSAVIVLSACPPRTSMLEGGAVAEARQVCEQFSLPVYPGQITQRAAYSHALIDGRAVTEFEPGGKAAAEIAALWKWIADQVGV